MGWTALMWHERGSSLHPKGFHFSLADTQIWRDQVDPKIVSPPLFTSSWMGICSPYQNNRSSNESLIAHILFCLGFVCFSDDIVGIEIWLYTVSSSQNCIWDALIKPCHLTVNDYLIMSHIPRDKPTDSNPAVLKMAIRLCFTTPGGFHDSMKQYWYYSTCSFAYDSMRVPLRQRTGLCCKTSSG